MILYSLQRTKKVVMNRKLREGGAAGQRGDVRAKYALGKRLGSGSFSRVTEGTCKATGKTFAIKSTILSRFPDKSMREDLMNETKLMLALDHPNIARTFEFYLDADVDTMHIVLEMLTGGDLMSMLEKGTGAIEEHRAAGWVLQMLSAIAYCHERRVCHRDLKPENFCFQSLAADAPLKLLDFGCSKQLDTAASTMTKKCGTWDYMAPEQIPSIDPQTGQRSRYGLGVDLWSIGVIAYVLLGMEFPFGWCADAERDAQADFTQRTIVTNILRGEYRPMEPHVDRELRWGKDETRMHGEAWTSVSAVAKDFVRRLLVVDPAQRMTAKEALKHPWLSAAHRDVLRGLERPAASRSAAAMLTFRRRTPMQKAAMHAIALQLSADELEELRKTFAAIDTDCDGTLSRAEVRAAFARLGVEGATTPRASLASGAFVAAGPSPINRMFSELGDDEGLRGGGGGDDDDAPHIGWHSFVAAALEQRHLEDADNVAAAFNALDVDHTGSISVHDLATVFGGGGGAGEGRSGEGELDRAVRKLAAQGAPRAAVVGDERHCALAGALRQALKGAHERTLVCERELWVANRCAAALERRAHVADVGPRAVASATTPHHKLVATHVVRKRDDGCTALVHGEGVPTLDVTIRRWRPTL